MEFLQYFDSFLKKFLQYTVYAPDSDILEGMSQNLTQILIRIQCSFLWLILLVSFSPSASCEGLFLEESADWKPKVKIWKVKKNYEIKRISW